MMLWMSLAIIGWAACGVLGYGLTFAFFQGKFSTTADSRRGEDRSFAFFIALLGPMGLGVAYFCGHFGRFGLRYR